jgi:carbonic anhydrase/acetyltransferase-like protein (isoleucine patch superfamily)
MTHACCVHARALVGWASTVCDRVIIVPPSGVHAQSSMVPVGVVVLAGLGKFVIEWKLEPVRRVEATVAINYPHGPEN